MIRAGKRGTAVGPGWVHSRVVETWGVPMNGVHVRCTKAQALLLKDYAWEWYSRPNAPTPGAWAQQTGREIPRAFHPPVAVKAKTKERRVAGGLEREIVELKREVAEIKKDLRRTEIARRINGDRTHIRALPSPPATRKRIVETVVSWARDRSGAIDYQGAWSEVYRAFWERVGGATEDWYACQLAEDRKLDYFQNFGLLDVLAEALPAILVFLSKTYPLNTAGSQRELSL